ncbi:MAG: hypothetical protein MMC33_009879 [Icmadophila ericetorum]|nr:hypothetical protein [Icmadophila ericetorum]
MFEGFTKLFTAQPEQASHQMTNQASPQSDAAIVDQQPTNKDQMTTEPAKMNLRGGGEGEDVCCGVNIDLETENHHLRRQRRFGKEENRGKLASSNSRSAVWILNMLA